MKVIVFAEPRDFLDQITKSIQNGTSDLYIRENPIFRETGI